MQRSALLLIIGLLFALASPLQAEETPETGNPLIAAASVALDVTTNLRTTRSNVTQGPVIEAKSDATSAANNNADYDLSYLLVMGIGVAGLLWIRRQAHNL